MRLRARPDRRELLATAALAHAGDFARLTDLGVVELECADCDDATQVVTALAALCRNNAADDDEGVVTTGASKQTKSNTVALCAVLHDGLCATSGAFDRSLRVAVRLDDSGLVWQLRLVLKPLQDALKSDDDGKNATGGVFVSCASRHRAAADVLQHAEVGWAQHSDGASDVERVVQFCAQKIYVVEQLTGSGRAGAHRQHKNSQATFIAAAGGTALRAAATVKDLLGLRLVQLVGCSPAVPHERSPLPYEFEDCEFLLLYFGGEWCPHCVTFLPFVKKLYDNLKATQTSAELVYVSSDRSEDAFHSYVAKHGEWWCLPYRDRGRQRALSEKYGVRGIPALVVLDCRSGALEVVTRDAAQKVRADSSDTGFPWRPQPFDEILRALSVSNTHTGID